MTIVTRALAWGIAIAALSACSNSSAPPLASHRPPQGFVVGHFLAVGGPSGALDSAQRGRIVVRRSGHVVTTVRVAQDGRYTLVLQPGTYSLRGYSPQYDGGKVACQPLQPTLEVVDGKTTRTNVYCQRR